MPAVLLGEAEPKLNEKGREQSVRTQCLQT